MCNARSRAARRRAVVSGVNLVALVLGSVTPRGRCGDEYVRWMVGRVRRVFDACRFVFSCDLMATAVESFLHDLREMGGRSVQTSNDHLQAVKQFARWMVDNDRLSNNPFARLKAGNAATDVRHRRGEFTADEVVRLLAATATSPTPFRGLTGSDRAMLYRVALNTGFRAKELAALSAESFVLTADTPVAVLPAGATKNRRPVRQPLPTDLARGLAVFLAGRTGTVWPGTWPTRSADMIARDMTAAGIAATVATPDGEQVRDFHSTRNTFIGNVLRAGANVKEAMALARHSDPRLTTARDARVRADELAAVVNRTPTPSVPTRAVSSNSRQRAGRVGDG